MKCLAVETLPRGPEWVYEVKFDGVRAFACKQGGEVSLISRNNKDLSSRYPAIAQAIRALPCRSALIDGEVVALDVAGRSSFQQLQNVQQLSGPLLYYAFDLLFLDDVDFRGMPLTVRKDKLERLLERPPAGFRYSGLLDAKADAILRRVRELGLEGIIAKKRGSLYESGRRSGSWVKFKITQQQEFVIGGYTQPEGTRLFFGALLVGYYSGKKLLFASRVGTGFDTAALTSLFNQFQKLKIAACPFANLPEPRGSTGRQGITASQMRLCTWVKPKLVAQVSFTEWTRDGHLRHPVYLGLREDKSPLEVVREIVPSV